MLKVSNLKKDFALNPYTIKILGKEGKERHINVS